jgi:hypothetical protein
MKPLKLEQSPARALYRPAAKPTDAKTNTRLHDNLTKYGVLMAVIRAHCLRLPMSLVFWLAGLGAAKTLCTTKELLARQEQRAGEALFCAMCSCIVLEQLGLTAVPGSQSAAD